MRELDEVFKSGDVATFNKIFDRVLGAVPNN